VIIKLSTTKSRQYHFCLCHCLFLCLCHCHLPLFNYFTDTRNTCRGRPAVANIYIHAGLAKKKIQRNTKHKKKTYQKIDQDEHILYRDNDKGGPDGGGVSSKLVTTSLCDNKQRRATMAGETYLHK